MKWILHLYDVNELVLLTLVEKLWYDNKWSSLSKMRTFRNVWNGYISKPLKFEILNKIKIYLNLFIPYCTIYYISLGLNQKLRSLFQFNCQKCADTHNVRMIRFSYLPFINFDHTYRQNKMTRVIDVSYVYFSIIKIWKDKVCWTSNVKENKWIDKVYERGDLLELNLLLRFYQIRILVCLILSLCKYLLNVITQQCRLVKFSFFSLSSRWSKFQTYSQNVMYTKTKFDRCVA